MHANMRRNARKTESRNIVPCKAATKSLRSICIQDRARRQAVEAEDRFVIVVVDSQEGFCAAKVMALTCMTMQKII